MRVPKIPWNEVHFEFRVMWPKKLPVVYYATITAQRHDLALEAVRSCGAASIDPVTEDGLRGYMLDAEGRCIGTYGPAKTVRA